MIEREQLLAVRRTVRGVEVNNQVSGSVELRLTFCQKGGTFFVRFSVLTSGEGYWNHESVELARVACSSYRVTEPGHQERIGV